MAILKIKHGASWEAIPAVKGDTGDPAVLLYSIVDYQEGESGTTPPTGTWSTTIPPIAPGNYLWTRVTLVFNSGTPVVLYTVSGLELGVVVEGTVQSINGISPDENGAVTFETANIEPTIQTVTIAVSDWNNQSCTKSVTGVTSLNTIIVTPDPSSFIAYGNSQIRATAQGDGTITFNCEVVPSESIVVTILIVG
jgi:hypothetical protein